MTNAGKPTKFILPEAATARMRPIVAMLPFSKYLKGAAPVSPLRRARITLPDVLALLNRGLRDTRSPLSDTMSPIANTSGWPGRVQSGAIAIRPARRLSARGAGEQTGQR